MNRRILALLLFLPGCSAGLGQFCFADSDCKAPLRCSATAGKRGVCTFVDGVFDLAIGPDQRADLWPLDVGPDTVDLGVDQMSPDRGPDGPVVDQMVDQMVDQTVPDQTTPDQTTPDQTTPDQTTVTPDWGLDL